MSIIHRTATPSLTRVTNTARLACVLIAFASTSVLHTTTLNAQQAKQQDNPQTKSQTAAKPAASPSSTAADTSAAPSLTSTALPGRQSWTSDRRNFQLGDIVTILVDEYTLTSLDKQVDATDNRQRDLNLGLSTPSTTSSYGFGTGSNNSSTTRGTDSRRNRLTTQMAARVVEISPNGIIRLEGTKALNVEKSKINLSLSGWVRTQDISSTNYVQSATLADAKLDYEAEGPLGTPKGGIISRLLGKFWP